MTDLERRDRDVVDGNGAPFPVHPVRHVLEQFYVIAVHVGVKDGPGIANQVRDGLLRGEFILRLLVAFRKIVPQVDEDPGSH